MPQEISCPSCSRTLRVPDELIGKNVRCPSCKTTFTAQTTTQPPPPPDTGNEIQTDEPPPSEPPPEKSRRRTREEEDEDDRPRRRSDSRRYRDDPIDGRPHKGGLILGLGIPSVVAGAVGLITSFCMCVHPVFAIIPMGFAVVAIAFGIPTWIMGNRDLASIKAGTMDPAGESLTRGGWICGLIGTILGILELLCGILLMILGALAVAGLVISQPPQ